MLVAEQFALTHVASQLIHRWLVPPPFEAQQVVGEHAAAEAVLSLKECDWLDLIQVDQHLGGPQLPWFRLYQKRGDPDGRLLARATGLHLAAVKAAHGTYLPLCDPRYPEALRQISDPPLALSLLGDVRSLALPAVSVVGSRKASALAMHASYDLGRSLANEGFLVVSGGAFGCDIAAHHGVLASHSHPSAAACVFAGGLAVLYPRANDAVFNQLRKQHALLISERLWTASCRPVDFMARNRIISGLGAMTALMQAAVRSGALVTARLALDQGREVAVLRHPAGDVRANGSAALIVEGAWGFSDAAEFLRALRETGHATIITKS